MKSENIRINYERMEDEKTKLLIALEAQAVQEKGNNFSLKKTKIIFYVNRK